MHGHENAHHLIPSNKTITAEFLTGPFFQWLLPADYTVYKTNTGQTNKGVVNIINIPFLSISSCRRFSISSSSAMSMARSPSLFTAATLAPCFSRYLQSDILNKLLSSSRTLYKSYLLRNEINPITSITSFPFFLRALTHWEFFCWEIQVTFLSRS